MRCGIFLCSLNSGDADGPTDMLDLVRRGYFEVRRAGRGNWFFQRRSTVHVRAQAFGYRASRL